MSGKLSTPIPKIFSPTLQAHIIRLISLYPAILLLWVASDSGVGSRLSHLCPPPAGS